jgi:hypothetical protein
MNLRTSVMCALALVACADDSQKPFVDADGDGIDDNDPTALRNFTLRIENVAPFTVLKASTQRTRPDRTDGNLAPGEIYEIRFTAGLGHRLSFASMLLESNDWFFGSDPAGIPLFNASGVPLSGDITNLVALWDAGTELDQEPGVGNNTGLLQTARGDGAADPNNLVRLVPDVVTLSNGSSFARPAIASMIRVSLTALPDRQFVMKIENVSTVDTLVTSTGNRAITVTPTLWAIHCNPNVFFEVSKPARTNGLEALAEGANPDTLGNNLRLDKGVSTPLSGGVFAVHADGMPLFAQGTPDRSLGLEQLAEDSNPEVVANALKSESIFGVESFGTFDVPVGGTDAAPCHAGQAFEVSFQARPGDLFSMVTAFSASNDWFIAPPGEGMALFNGTLPRWGEITNEFRLYDLGTEYDEELDVGANTGTQQFAAGTANVGRVDRTTEIREVGRDRYDVPLTRHLRVTLMPPTK